MAYFFTQIFRFFETITMAVGLQLAISMGGIFFFGFPVAVSFAAYAFVLMYKAGMVFPLAVFLSLLLTVLLGFLYALLYRRLSTDSFAVFTLASVLAFDTLLRSWDSLTGGVLGISGIARPAYLGTLQLLTLGGAIFAVLVLITHHLILKSPYARKLRGHREEKTYLAASGIDAHLVGTVAILIAAFLGGVAGIFGVLRIQFLDPSFGGIPLVLQGLTIAIIAMRPKVSSLLLAVLFLVGLPELLRFFDFPSTMLGHMRTFLYAFLLIVLVRRLSGRYTAEKRFV